MAKTEPVITAPLEPVPEPTTSPAPATSAPDFSVNYDVVGQALQPLLIQAIERFAMTIPDDAPSQSIALAKAVILEKIQPEKIAKIFFAGLPESYPQIIGVIDCVRYEQRLTLPPMALVERHNLLAQKAAEHLAALPIEQSDMGHYLSSAWEGIAARLVD
jgi:hypothetical protein